MDGVSGFGAWVARALRRGVVARVIGAIRAVRMVALACVALGMACSTLRSDAQAQDPAQAEVWMTYPNPWALTQSEEWAFVKENVDGIKLYIDQIYFADPAELRAFVVCVEEAGIELAVELGGLVDWRAVDGSNSAERSFADEVLKFKKLVDPYTGGAEGGAGGSVAYIDMDGPIRRMLYPFAVEQDYHTTASAIAELIDVLGLWKAAYPQTRVMLLTNFPNWGWQGGPAYHNFGYAPQTQGYGDYHTVLGEILTQSEATGVTFDGITVDNPYDYALGEHLSNQPAVTAGVEWMARLMAIENYAEGRGYPFQMIFNSERGGEGGGSNEYYFNESLAFIDDYHAAGGSPALYMMQTWYFYPDALLPEYEPYTMTNLVRETLRKLRGASAKSLSLEAY